VAISKLEMTFSNSEELGNENLDYKIKNGAGGGRVGWIV
jgi:hypothetical protein